MAQHEHSDGDHDAETIDPQSSAAGTSRIGTPPGVGQPQRIGRYRIKRAIASGGMGTVYEAVQEHPRRVVAVKVMRQGIASRSALRRFEYESQILGRLRHPGIAQVYDAGMHDDGTGGVPYFAMEYIAGAKDIVEYATARRLGTRQRLELFIKVCEAVHHGHQKGIIHRDLKPANILIDSSGQPKIIDFGVARATDSDLAVTTLQTDVGQLVGTVQYMSPEQIDADPHDIDTRSDVYALGVVLYKVLTGELPYDVANTVIYEATRLIREHAPKRISSFNKALRGDIETIVLHALEKDRDRRYQSALELARDIRRHLDSRTILARPPSVVYQLRTFVRRNKLLVGAAAAVFLALAVGVVGTSTGWYRANKEHLAAVREANTAKAITRYFQSMFASLDAREGTGYDARVADLLDAAAADIEVSLASEPQVQSSVRESIGNGYLALALYEQAEEQLRKALATKRRLLEEHEEVAQALQDLGSVVWFRHRYREAEDLFAEALAMRRGLYDGEHPKIADSLNYLAACLDPQGRHHEAEGLFRQSLAMRRSLYGPRHEMVARSLNNLATCLVVQERYEEAEPLFREAVQIVRSQRGDRHVDVGAGLSNIARCLMRMGRLEEAEPLFRQALAIKLENLGPEHASVAKTRHYLAHLLQLQDRYEEALEQAVQALGVRQQILEPDNPDAASSRSLLAIIRAHLGAIAHDEAAAVLQETLELIERRLGPDHRQTRDARERLQELEGVRYEGS